MTHDQAVTLIRAGRETHFVGLIMRRDVHLRSIQADGHEPIANERRAPQSDGASGIRLHSGAAAQGVMMLPLYGRAG